MHEIRRTVTDMDNILFSALTYNPAAIHIDHEYAKTTEFGKPLINSIFTLGLVVGLSVQDTTLGTTVGNLGWEEVAFPKPVFAGDTIRAETKVVGLRDSEVAADAGDRHLRTQGAQPARRDRLHLPARRADAEEARVKLRSLLFVPGNSERKFVEGAGVRRGRADPRSRGFRRAAPKGGSARPCREAARRPGAARLVASSSASTRSTRALRSTISPPS